MATEWFCRIMDDQWGPMSAQELTLVARRGRLTRDDLVRRGERGTWVRAELVAGLFNAEASPQSAARRQLAATPIPAKRSVGVRSPIQSKPRPAQSQPLYTPTQYWISNGHRTAGPFTSIQIRHLAATGQLHRNHLLRSTHSAWILARRVKGLTLAELDHQPASVAGRWALTVT